MNYQLPKLEFKKFGGEPREWITFWSQFSTIDRDPQMPPETKFQYLFQATAENSENVRAEGKMSVVKLYDRLETQLRALETLGVARDKFVAMLYPLVESALPEDTLRVWERSQYTVSGIGVQDKLTQLMTFLKTEVKGESRVNMAKAAFKIDNNQDAKDDRSNRKSLSKKNTGSKMPMATDLANTTQMRNNCIFCGNGHQSQECYSRQRMHLPEKKDKAKGKNVCFWCLLPGHGFKKCRIKPRCPVCRGKHYPIMCPTLEAQKTSHLQKAELKVSRESPTTEQETANQFTSTTLNNATVGGVYLQTLIVKISGPKGKHNVRVLLDCGSQRSYISKIMVDALGLKRVQQVTLTHNLFGGGEIRQKKHNVYKVNVSSLNNEYMDDLKFLDQEVICGHISQQHSDRQNENIAKWSCGDRNQAGVDSRASNPGISFPGIPESNNDPEILGFCSKNPGITELIVKSVHEKMYHCGAQTLRSVLREKFWIPKAQQLVRHVIHKCPRCRRFETKRVNVPEASLPQHRVQDVVVYEVTGIDLGGPLYLEDGQKVCTERSVGLTKKLLRRLLGKRVVNYEEMVTILENCERVINARPLTYIAEDNDDLVPLTPEMFLREPRAEGEIDLNEFRCNFGKSYEKCKRLLKEFRKRFRSEYLGLLVHHDNRKKQRQLKVGDIVLVEVENRKQINWPMGKITKVFPGTDNV
ncbi:hypothetical protein LAZ67_X002286 [Cordylochernes scorpioides]|uniref:DUF5641 domain-containing protein n=1 Tax=Cordylochernes scorpioides TaxID=51811 RepID=A0ABY6LXC8_9ARAC|nr:hypothetical protein LAZ67_X002286 [Cordylochernes scorpioides]